MAQGDSSPNTVGIKLGDRRMDRHHAGVGRGRDARRHRLDHGVDRLVAPDAQDRGAEDGVAVAVDHHLHEALRLALLDRAADAGHRPAADPHRMALGARLGLGHADAAERRIDVEGVGRNAVAHPARRAVEQVRGDDLEIVVGGVGEGAAAVAVAERPDARDAGPQLVVDDDVAAARRPRRPPPRARGRRCSAGGPPRAARASRATSGSPVAQSTPTAMSGAARREADAFGVEPDRDALGFEDLADRVRHLLVLAGISRGAFSTTVTAAPKRRKICANSRPM